MLKNNFKEILLPPYLLFGDQLSLFSYLSYQIFHQIVHHVWIEVSPPPSVVLLIFFCCLHCPHVSSMGLPQLGMKTISKHRSTSVLQECISVSVL